MCFPTRTRGTEAGIASWSIACTLVSGGVIPCRQGTGRGAHARPAVVRGNVEGELLLCPREREWISGALRPRGIGKQACPARERALTSPRTGGAGGGMDARSATQFLSGMKACRGT
jgi:hypothetical protein